MSLCLLRACASQPEWILFLIPSCFYTRYGYHARRSTVLNAAATYTASSHGDQDINRACACVRACICRAYHSNITSHIARQLLIEYRVQYYIQHLHDLLYHIFIIFFVVHTAVVEVQKKVIATELYRSYRHEVVSYRNSLPGAIEIVDRGRAIGPVSYTHLTLPTKA